MQVDKHSVFLYSLMWSHSQKMHLGGHEIARRSAFFELCGVLCELCPGRDFFFKDV